MQGGITKPPCCGEDIMVKDRNAFLENKNSQGVPADEARTPRAFGVPKAGYGNLIPARARMRGVTMDEIGYIEKNYPQSPVVTEVIKCLGKEGTCKARPIKGTQLCVGHTRQVESAGDKE